jgi:hypothetical protein
VETEQPRGRMPAPRHPGPEALADYEGPPIPRRIRVFAWIVVCVLVGGAAVTGLAGVDALLHAQWRFGVEMLGLTAAIVSIVPKTCRARHSHVNVSGEVLEATAAESRAMRETLERHDRLVAEARMAAGPQLGREAARTEERGEA